ncbi:MAG: hypothetical protein ABR524_11230 [Thermoanaerobaculia bacterium]
MKRILLPLLLLAVAFLPGCQSEEPAATATAPMGQTQPPHSMTGMEGITSGAPDPASAGVAYQLPDGWNRVQPASSMRIDQAVIPGAAGSAELVVFFFGVGSGGGTQDNLDRWAQQVESQTPPTQETFQSNGLNIVMIDTSGVLMPSTMGSGPATPQPNSRMYGAVVEGEGGPWFFKMTGPEETMAQQRDNFLQLLRTVTRTGAAV